MHGRNQDQGDSETQTEEIQNSESPSQLISIRGRDWCKQYQREVLQRRNILVGINQIKQHIPGDISYSTVQRMLASNLLPAYQLRPGGMWRIHIDSLHEALASTVVKMNRSLDVSSN